MNAESKRAKLITALSVQTTGPVPVAIIGLSGCFPQSNDVNAFWEALDTDRSLIGEIPSSRMDWDRFFDPAGKDPNKSHTRWGGLIPDIRRFDAPFFHILPAEADKMDPRKRLLLMSVQHALEDAGYAGSALKNQRVGVFVAAEEDEFRQCLLEKGIDTRTGGGNSSSLLANQISYFFDFRGPSELVNTMCSGAAVAIHRAVKALRTGEIDYAVVSAANLLLHPDPFVYLSRTGQMSPEPTVRSFGRDAKGFCRAEGVASIVLKSLPAARADKDAIYALVRHTAVNYNGQGGLSMAAPNIPAHTDVVYSCYTQAGIDPRQVGYIEAQGMGNPVADIAEWEAFNNAIKKITSERNLPWRPYSCRVSTLKPVTGHMHSASALGALLRIIRTFQTNKAHGIAGFTTVNPDLLLEDQPCRLLTATEDWPEEEEPRLAGLHSYGSGGNNAHLLIEEYKAVPVPPVSQGDKQYVIPCSAKSVAQCRTIASSLAAELQRHPEYTLSSIAFTLQTGRTALEARVAFVTSSTVELIRLLQAYAAEQHLTGIYTGNTAPAPVMARNTTDHVARAWTEGAEIIWEQQPFFAPAARLHLPVYPYNYKEYWPLAESDIPAMVPSPQAESVIRECLGRFLKTTPGQIDLQQQFSSMGFDSLLVVELSRQLEQTLNLRLQAGIFFEYTTPAALIGFITQQPAPANSIRPVRSPGLGDDADAIAIVGLAGSFPQSPDMTTFWNNLLAGRHCIEEVPPDRWPLPDHYDSDKEQARRTGKSYAKWGGFLQDLYCFDPLFFNIAPSEAASMNPKERIFLQCAWHVLEDAGYTPGSLATERVGVFAGVTRSGLDPYRVSGFPVANRVSYTFNFHGPSLVIDTACSSSLIAIHEACRNIRSGECTVALAGGVHAFLAPSHFAALSALQMLSPDGTSRSFGENANGMVPGEGVGAVLLKPLSQAIACNDHIYGVIRASSSNHGGKSNGFTVPNPGAHTALIRDALEKAHVHARDISCAEAHGTGTALGDPIEIRGLTEAFQIDGSEKQYCSLGSVKSNIGHLEAAAGISGLAKVLLQMQHGKLVPSLHARQPNPQIDFSATPFVIQQEVSDWTPVDGSGQPLPRLACLSSFGAGGSNAHLIVQDHPREDRPAPAPQTELIVLSARNGKQLRQCAQQLVAFLSGPRDRDDLLQDIAYTLQVGREAMEERLAVEVDGTEQLIGQLQAWLERQSPANKLYTGTVRRLPADGHREQMPDDYDTVSGRSGLLSRWVQGYPVDWHRLHAMSAQTKPSRISLPLYPFEKEYFGPSATLEDRQAPVLPGHQLLHPLVHSNESTFSHQLYTSLFTGEEAFLKDHVIDGARTLPGVAYLEMARAAFNLALDPNTESGTAPAILLRNVGWARPVTVDVQPQKLFIRLWPLDAGDFGFSIGNQADDILHCQGAITWLSPNPEDDPQPAPLDLDKIRSQLTGRRYTGETCYQEFIRMGVSYGTSHQGLQYIQVGEDQLLAKLFLPETAGDETRGLSPHSGSLYLHPGIMDAATQAVMGFLIMGRKAEDPLPPLAVPYALQELRVHRPCGTDMWAYIRCNKINNNVNNKEIHSLSFDINICDPSGEVAVQAKGFISRTKHRTSDLLFFKPAWVEQAVLPAPVPPPFERHVVVLPSHMMAGVPAMSSIRLIPMEEGGSEKDLLPQAMIEQVFGIVQDQLRSRQLTMTQILLAADPRSGCCTAISGLLKTASRENPAFRGQVITLDRDVPKEDIPSILLACSRQPEDQDIRYSAGRRWVSRLEEFSPPSPEPASCWKNKGVYLITGGAGGLGLLFAREIARQARKVVIILSGRSAINARIGQRLEELRAETAHVEYRQTNVADNNEATALITYIQQQYGRLDGILHAAGVVKDGFIIRKTDPEVREVLAPKVQGLINLDEASRHLPLDYFILFSSVTGVTGNTGQSDYAVANAFMDAYARYRQSMAAAALRSGRTIAVNWPLWSEGGMQVPSVKQEELKQNLGMTPLPTTTGLEAFYRLVQAGETQAMVAQGDPVLLRKTFLQNRTPIGDTIEEKGMPPAAEVSAASQEDALYFFKKVLSAAIGLSPDRIDAGKPMEEYGIDSIMVMKMTADLEKVFGSLPKTLFFEYASISELTDYFLTRYAGQLKKLLHRDTSPNDHQTGGQPVAGDRTTPRTYAKSIINRTPPERGQQEGIAIIGLSGQYPQARTLDLFWENLLAGRNCITEIPEDRWDHSPYFDPDNKKTLKTNTKWGGFLEGMREFDPLFFNISFKEAETIDPQERLFLQTAYAAIEDAGYTRQRLALNAGEGNVGVYVGVMWNEYQLLAAGEIALGRPMVLSSGSSSIANRVSYYCNFNGPSIAVDTMCSSSLTAIHLACQSLHSGECGIAIAGGVNVSIHPNKYLILGYSKMASSKGLCESFGREGDGYVPSEGVGAVVLKPLSRAISDGDHIYGVIRGSAINHGGKVNGYSVPNPKAQSQAIGRALEQARWDPRTVSYIEAHGTGTALGDPIEIAALSNAFQAKERQFCAIGSVKSNIGHCESAAGIAGLSKVLLQMKHGLLVPSLHSLSLNENIDFENSPFRVQQAAAEWKRPVTDHGGSRKEYPRRAGISSFGAGGSNAHLVVEEFVPRETGAPYNSSPGRKVAIVLSARDDIRLKEAATGLLSALRNKAYAETQLEDIAYTLQTGREDMEQRVAMEVSTLADMEEQLSCYIQGSPTERLYIGKQQIHKDLMSIFTSDQDMEQALENWFKKRKYTHLLGLWVNGIQLDWEKLYAAEARRPRRMSLPAYPFSRERYWPLTGLPAVLPGAALKPAAILPPGVQPSIHPLIHENTSTFSQQRFTSTFTGQEFFLDDHRINGEKTLPGAACIEMIREAVRRSSGDADIYIRLENMAWAEPITVNGHPATIDILLTPGRKDDIGFEISSRKLPATTQAVVHTRGAIRYVEATSPPLLEPEKIKQTLSGPAISAEACYDFFTRMGIFYGPGHRAIESLIPGGTQLLAKLHLPDAVAATASGFYLHPGVMDAAFQAIAGFWIPRYYSGETIPLMVPFAAKSIDILAPCAGSAWVHVRSAGSIRIGEKMHLNGQYSFDLDISDAAGNICVQVRGLSVRQMISPAFPGLLLLEHYWKPDETRQAGELGPGVERHVILIGREWQTARPSGNGLAMTALQATDMSPAAAFEFYATAVFNEVQKILRSGPRSQVIMQLLLSTQDDQAVHNGLAGLLKTANWENPLFTGQVIAADPATPHETLLAILNDNLKEPADTVIRYRSGQREVLSLREAPASLNIKETTWREDGVYLITGGAGGLGLLFATEIASTLKNGVVILAGRSPLSPALEQRLSCISASAVRVLYRQADITDAAATQQLIQSITAEFGGLNGIIHSAGVLHDNLILRKEPSAIQRVLAPKVYGTFNLDRAASEVSLDFFLCCSSVTGATGNAGQSDYAMANAFQDAYAAWRQELVEKGKRHGKTLSIGWPLWEDGGMQIPNERKALLRDRYGIEALQTGAGMHAFSRAMGMNASAVMVLQGNPVMLRDTFLTPQAKVLSKPATNGSDKKPAVESWLKSILSAAIKVPAERIRSDKTMEEYGIDSVVIMQMTYEMEQRFGNLSKTLFFEYRTIEELAEYFLRTFPGHWETADADAILDADAVPAADAGQAPDQEQRYTGIPNRFAPKVEKQECSPSQPGKPDIAIIGLAGKYPGAGNIEEFWKILRDGVNCITEVPESRWDHRRYFDEEKNKKGKTYGKWGGFIDGVDAFDPVFFNITPKEAESMDPQERLFLECAYEAIEDAGYTRDTLGAGEGGGKGGQVGVFVGVMTEEYQLYGPTETAQGRPLVLGGNTAAIANRISYFCNFNGPSIALNTMCSSSLTSIHLACQSLMTGECRAAIAGGVNVTVHPNKYLALAYANFLSSKGLCESFGADGDGYVPGEGVGVVVLKPLAQAIADRDQVYGVIKGSSINHGGRTNGNTVPNPAAQANVIANAIAASGFDPHTISYVEAHGTGTSLGDPIEINGLIRGFNTSGRQYCAIGSVKSNIGHGESAAGIAGLTKVLLQMKYGLLAPSLHSENPNPHIDFANSPFKLQKELSQWHRPQRLIDGVTSIYPRRAGISSFGAGGANAHLLIEEFIDDHEARHKEDTGHSGPWSILLSARNAEQLKSLALRMIKWVEALPETTGRKLADMAYTLRVGREIKEETLSLQVSSFGELTQKLNRFISDGIKEREPAFGGMGEPTSSQRSCRPRRISLPTYPFLRRRCWFDQHPELPADATPDPGAASKDGAEKWLTGLFARELKMDMWELQPDKAFQDYGIDSIMITQLLRPVRESLGKDIDPSILFEYSTVRSFTSWLQATYPRELAAITAGKQASARVRSEPPPAPAAKPPVAVVGMSCRFPGADDLDSFWRLLQEGRSAIRTIPADRWMTNVQGYAGLIDHSYHFDPAFFLLAEDDARAMDPQALLVLEESLLLFHHAGYVPEEVRGKNIGVYLGGRSRHTPSSERFELAPNPAMATGQNYLSSNISRFFDLRGPSVVIDTACSSALVAMKMAMQALQEGEMQAAVVGGVSLLHSSDTWQLFRKRGLLSNGQDFHILDSRAGGIILGEGVGMVLLKTVEQALKDGDKIYAVIDSIAINNDGRSAGPATPNITALREVMQSALNNSGKKAAEISYIEVNGSGSEITDLIEMKAIDSIYRPSGGFCSLGSVKPNIGHPLAAEGIAAFIKVVCMLHHREFVPFLSGQQSIRHFDLSASPFIFTRQSTPWPEGPATAAINCFADGGTNAHVIVQAWNGNKDHSATRNPLSPPLLERIDLSVEHRYVSVWETFE